MTPDHTPFLRPGVDLCTAEDVLAWMAKHVAGVRLDLDTGTTHDIDIAVALRARLDRERRQACRRGCFAMFREACRERGMERCPPAHPPRYGGWSLASSAYREHRIHYLRRALAFRAAARAK